jgi:IS30 family transposase
LRRPDVFADREQFGHWECDLKIRKKFGKANVTSLVERISRFVIFLRNNDRQSRPVMEGLIQVLQALPYLARRSITFDRGTEFTDWPYLQARIATKTWFREALSPWQKGTVKNTNDRMRKRPSIGGDPLTVTDADLIEILAARENLDGAMCLKEVCTLSVPDAALRQSCSSSIRQSGSWRWRARKLWFAAIRTVASRPPLSVSWRAAGVPG